jgi:hypothetical protein
VRPIERFGASAASARSPLLSCTLERGEASFVGKVLVVDIGGSHRDGEGGRVSNRSLAP